MKAQLGLTLAALALACALALGLYWKGRLEGAARLKPRIAASEARAKVADLEQAGAKAQTDRIEVLVRQQAAVAGATQDLAAQLQTSEDADAPLAPERLARLRAHDRRLCDAAPGLAGCAPDAAADDRPDTLPAGPAGAGRDPG